MNCKKLNNKGFSLVEILVAVSIIGIIAAIAVPAFQDYRANAAKVAGDTSIGNVQRAFQNCLVLKDITACRSLSGLGVSCPDCKTGVSGDNFCAQIEKKVGGDIFRACVDFDGSDLVGRAYGGKLFENIKLCHVEVKSCTNTGDNKAKAAKPGAIECTATNATTVCGAASTTDTTTNCVTENTCASVAANDAKCGSTTGVCTR